MEMIGPMGRAQLDSTVQVETILALLLKLFVLKVSYRLLQVYLFKRHLGHTFTYPASHCILVANCVTWQILISQGLSSCC